LKKLCYEMKYGKILRLNTFMEQEAVFGRKIQRTCD
jgi:hypothetical protein